MSGPSGEIWLSSYVKTVSNWSKKEWWIKFLLAWLQTKGIAAQLVLKLIKILKVSKSNLYSNNQSLYLDAVSRRRRQSGWRPTRRPSTSWICSKKKNKIRKKFQTSQFSLRDRRSAIPTSNSRRVLWVFAWLTIAETPTSPCWTLPSITYTLFTKWRERVEQQQYFQVRNFKGT